MPDKRRRGYTPDEVYDAFVSYGESGRRLYTRIATKIDPIFTIVYSALTVLTCPGSSDQLLLENSAH